MADLCFLCSTPAPAQHRVSNHCVLVPWQVRTYPSPTALHAVSSVPVAPRPVPPVAVATAPTVAGGHGGHARLKGYLRGWPRERARARRMLWGRNTYPHAGVRGNRHFCWDMPLTCVVAHWLGGRRYGWREADSIATQNGARSVPVGTGAGRVLTHGRRNVPPAAAATNSAGRAREAANAHAR